jgi:hypothetical protein
MPEQELAELVARIREMADLVLATEPRADAPGRLLADAFADLDAEMLDQRDRGFLVDWPEL